MKSAKDLLASNGRQQDWSSALVLAVREVFELMLGSELSVPASVNDSSFDITSMIGLAGDLCGVLSLRCDRQLGALIASRMLRMEIEDVEPAISDALGEVCNMIAGNFKSKIAGLRAGCMLSIPTVIQGTDYRMYLQSDAIGLEVGLLFESLPMIVTLHIRN